MDNTELKPCPFCGEKAVLHVDGGVCVVCTECEIRTVTLIDGRVQGKLCGSAINRVIEIWNRRV